jgi:hypothetical protein
MKLSFMVMTLNGGWRLERLLRNVGGRADEIVVGVDAATTDDTFERARCHTPHVVTIDNPQGFIEPHIAGLFHRCSGDWVLRLDDDELISTNFQLSALPADVLERFDLIGFPRAWVVRSDPLMYIGTGRERGELVPQFRLMRRSADWQFIDRIHTPGFEMRPAHVAEDICIFHLNLLDQPYGNRKKKYDFYQSHRDAPWNRTYLFDPPELVRSGQALPCPSTMFPPTELIRSTPSTAWASSH